MSGSTVYLSSSRFAVTINTNVNASSSTIWRVPGFNSSRLFWNDTDSALGTNTLSLQSAGNFNDGGQISLRTGTPDVFGVRAESVRINQTGNVGIGISNPQHQLDVYSPSRSSLRLGTANTSVVMSAINGLVSVTPSSLTNFVVGNDHFFVNGTSGNVGIGSSLPDATLNISKNVPGSIGPVLSLKNSTGNVGDSAQIRFDVGGLIPNGTIDWITDVGSNTILSVKTTKGGTLSESLRINGQGNVGINTASPGSRLSVNGVIESTSGGFKFPNGNVQIQPFEGGVVFSSVPAGPASPGSPGQMAYGAGYLYLAVSANQWVRIPVETSWS
jgi:hypothetical protein